MKSYIAVNKSWAGHTLLGFIIAAALSTSIIAIALKYYMTIKIIFWQQQAVISRLQQKEIVYSFLQRDLKVQQAAVIVISAMPIEVYNKTAGKVAKQISAKIIAKISNQQIKYGSTILLMQKGAYYLAKDSRDSKDNNAYTLFRDDFIYPAVGIADGIANFTVHTAEHTDRVDKKVIVLSFTVEYVRNGVKDINTKQQFKLVAIPKTDA